MVTKYKTLLEGGVPTLVKERSYKESGILSAPLAVVDVLNNCFQLNRETEEHVYLLCTNTKHRCVGVFEVAHGTVDASSIGVREILMKALLCGAVGIIVAHNHPSGDSTPSRYDDNATERIKNGADAVGIRLNDHIIVGNGNYYSYAEGGKL